MTMLDSAVALILSGDPVWLERCRQLCLSLGMARAYPFVGVEDMARRTRTWPIQFVIANALDGREAVAEALGAVRAHREADVRFCPVMVLSKDTASAALRPFLAMGCDDIVSFPTSRGNFASRLTLQVSRPLDYYETAHYFGPDRRRLLDPATKEHAQRGEGGPVIHYVIQRDPKLGTRILAREEEAGRRKKVG